MAKYLIEEPREVVIPEHKAIYATPVELRMAAYQDVRDHCHKDCWQCKSANMSWRANVLTRSTQYRFGCTASFCKRANWGVQGPGPNYIPASVRELRELEAELADVDVVDLLGANTPRSANAGTW